MTKKEEGRQKEHGRIQCEMTETKTLKYCCKQARQEDNQAGHTRIE